MHDGRINTEDDLSIPWSSFNVLVAIYGSFHDTQD